MPFLSGRVSFAAYRVRGDAPVCADETLLGILQDHAFKESARPRADEEEIGFTSGIHLLDTQFTYEKNAFDTCVHFALRIDTHAVPSDVKKAYKLINEQAAAAASPTGFASKREKREARETADQQMQKELSSGKYRKSKLVPILWDLDDGTLYAAAPGPAVGEALAKVMREAFELKLEPLTAGARAGEMAKRLGAVASDLDALRPTAFTPPPAGAPETEKKTERELPPIPWVAKSADVRDFLGNEFLLWLLWKSQTSPVSPPEKFKQVGELQVTPWKTLDLECGWGTTGKTSLRQGSVTESDDSGGSPMKAPEAIKALASGKWPRKLGFMLSNPDQSFELTLQGDQFLVSGGKLPEVEEVNSDRELGEARIELIRGMNRTLEGAYAAFLSARLGRGWDTDAGKVGQWMRGK